MPHERWREAEEAWRLKCVVPKAKAQIKADFDLYARDYNPYSEDYRNWHGKDDDW